MTRFVFILLAGMLLALHVGGVTPYCDVRLYDEDDGLSQRSVKQIAVDSTGMVWVATWNGLNRFDGYEFAVIRPQPGDSARRYSSRFRDLRAGAGGSLWCRIDDRLVMLDPAVNRFSDIHSALEERFGRPLAMKAWRQSADGDTMVMECEGVFVSIPENNPVDGASLSPTLPKRRYSSPSNRKVGDFGPYAHSMQAYGREDNQGHVWIVTRTGTVVFAPDRESRPQVMAELGITDGSLQYAATDRQGGLWFRSTQGAHRLSPGTLPYDTLPSTNHGRILAAAHDPSGRLWVGETDRRAIAVHTTDGGSPLYLTPAGELTQQFTPWGHAVYSLYIAPDGRVWVGCKPDGLFRMTPLDDGSYEVTHIAEGNIYGITPGPDGTLWVATLGNGILNISPDGTVRQREGVPGEACRVRRIVFAGDTLAIAATTGGLLMTDTRTGRTRLHVTEASRRSSLGCIAVTDIAVTPGGEIYFSTESDGINMLTGGAMAPQGMFSSFNDPGGNRLDVVQAMTLMPGGTLLAVGPGHLYALDPLSPESPVIYGEGFWHSKLRFTDMRPVQLADGRWLLGTSTGGIAVNLDALSTPPGVRRVNFTSASIQGRGDTLLTSATQALTLDKHERSLTLRFAATDYDNPGDLRYEVRINGEEWTRPSHSRSLTLYDLAPGRYEIEVAATDPIGRWRASRTMTLTVTPRFHETLAAKLLLLALIIAAVAGGIRLAMYIRAIKRKQHDTLEAYLRLVEQTSATHHDSPQASAPASPATRMSEDDNLFMERVMEYVTTHISDPEAGVEPMAAAAGVSRSGLARKMKSLMGVTPADFIKQTRLTRAASLLSTTDMPVKEIAYECGFADLNYFGKCFKGAHNLSPTAYRAAAR